eukprot:TRINITY_DN3203_c0_g1_i8.p1 TRINITY_DN3203_c0_g1~~TRINITY_DN3203_c0_g1_i8.p1  ORF type:complete len:745 (+),score=131.71 TRINITY_DN3203_c0_g1_i8:493-2727(+)
MPQPTKWTKLRYPKESPKPRSGHSIISFGKKNIMFGGLVNDETEKEVKVDTTNDTYLIGITERDAVFTKLECKGAELPLKRSCHSACAIGLDKMFVFGGYYDNKVRLNDVWILQTTTSEYIWKRPPGHPPTVIPPKNEASPIGGPEPRADAACCFLDGKVYIFGGYGGIRYQRKNFNDLYSFDLEKGLWEKIEYENVPPEPRSGHIIFPYDSNSLYIFGGWSNESQYKGFIRFDLTSCNWGNAELESEIPMWNHSGVLVNAIPNKKYFLFGGMRGDFAEGRERQIGKYSNDIIFLDIDSSGLTLQNVELDETVEGEKPERPVEREKTAMFYDEKTCRLIIYGGWSKKWLDDTMALNVGKIVGPDYAIKTMNPDKGQLSGGTKVNIKGQGFVEGDIMIVRFSSGKQFAEAQATYISEDELECVTPSFEAFGPKEVEVKLQRQGQDLSITSSRFSFFKNTRAIKSVAFGPGVSDTCLANNEAEFLIQARNEDSENRSSGRDTFEAKAFMVSTREVTVQEIGEEPRIEIVEDVEEELPCEIVDNDDGSYFVKYKNERPGKVKLEVKFRNEKGILEPLRGSPFYTNFVEDENLTPAHNKLEGPMVVDNTQKMIEELERFMKETLSGASTKDKPIKENVKVLLKVKEHVRSVDTNKDSIILRLDAIEESLKMLSHQSRPKETFSKRLRELNKNWNEVQKNRQRDKERNQIGSRTGTRKHPETGEGFRRRIKNVRWSYEKEGVLLLFEWG